ncbi:MAG: NusG domain II-containing protein [Lachnospiraceae bacterium]|nr:NusG domain II-containing protein [Lachnospiraceae bacterium]
MKTDKDIVKLLQFKKADLILVAALIISALLLLFSGFLYARRPGALWVRGYLDGKRILEYPIESSVRTVVHSPDGAGYNVLVINDKNVCVDSADCPGQDCVNRGIISKSGEEIICLPHKLVIRIEGGEGIDAMAD